MPDVNWEGVWQSITDTWLPALVVLGLVTVGFVIFAKVRRKKK